MRHNFLAAGLFVVLSLSAGPAFGGVCLGKSMTLDEVVDTINATSGCERAMKVFEDCELSSSGDIRLGAAVEKKCEHDFLGHLGAPQKQAYQRQMRVCDRKYENESGTMYRSFTASCRAQISQRYSRGALKAASPSRAR
jgi:hypothetical protein